MVVLASFRLSDRARKRFDRFPCFFQLGSVRREWKKISAAFGCWTNWASFVWRGEFPLRWRCGGGRETNIWVCVCVASSCDAIGGCRSRCLVGGCGLAPGVGGCPYCTGYDDCDDAGSVRAGVDLLAFRHEMGRSGLSVCEVDAAQCGRQVRVVVAVVVVVVVGVIKVGVPPGKVCRQPVRCRCGQIAGI